MPTKTEIQKTFDEARAEATDLLKQKHELNIVWNALQNKEPKTAEDYEHIEHLWIRNASLTDTIKVLGTTLNNLGVELKK